LSSLHKIRKCCKEIGEQLGKLSTISGKIGTFTYVSIDIAFAFALGRKE